MKQVAISILLLLTVFLRVTLAQGQELLSTDEVTREYLRKARNSLKEGNIDGAIGFGLLGLGSAESHPDLRLTNSIYLFLGEAYTAKSDYENAIFYYLSIIENDGQNVGNQSSADAHHALGKLYGDLGIRDRAIDHYLIAQESYKKLDATSKLAKTLFLLSREYFKVKQLGLSNRSLEWLIKLTTDNDDIANYTVKASKQLFQNYLQLDSLDKAAAYGEKYFELLPDEDAAEKGIAAGKLAGVYRSIGDFNKLLFYGQIAAKFSPDNLAYLMLLGEGYLGTRQLNDAQKVFSRIVNLAAIKKDQRILAASLNSLAKTQYLKKDDRASLSYLQRAEYIGKKNNLTEIMIETNDIYYRIYQRRKNQSLANNYIIKNKALQKLIKEEEKEETEETNTKEIENIIDKYEQNAKIKLAEIQNKELTLAKRKMEIENEQERQRLIFLEQQNLLHQQKLKEKELLAERVRQQLLISEKEFESSQKEIELKRLKTQSELQKMAELENQKALELSEKERELLEQETLMQSSIIEAENKTKLIYYILIATSFVLLLIGTIAFIKTHRSKKTITKQNENLALQQATIQKRNMQLLKVQKSLESTLKKEVTLRNELVKKNKEIKDTQSYLVQNEKMSSLGQLTAGIAHEINNPINFVSSGVQSLQENIEQLFEQFSDYERATQLKTIEDIQNYFSLLNSDQNLLDDLKSSTYELIKDVMYGTNRVTEIVDGLKTFSRKDEAVMKTAHINEIIIPALKILESKYKNKVEVATQFDDDIPEIECLPGQLNQAFVNLIGNAIDAISDKGTITIVTTNISKDKIRIIIRDTGSGIAKEKLAKIFDPFFTTKEVGKGTGLGLSITHGIVQRHKGSIEVKSKVGVGTAFIITLPKKIKISEKELKGTV